MDGFYINCLKSNRYILDTEVPTYTSNGAKYGDFEQYSRSVINQKVFAIDAVEAKENVGKFAKGKKDK